MAPVRSYSNWNIRQSDRLEQIEPYGKYFFICEGANTETWYFQKLIDRKRELGIHPLLDICLLEKTGEDRDITYPQKLLDFANDLKENGQIDFDPERDKMIVVFDADIFEEKVSNYQQLLERAQMCGDVLAVTNPAFELFLLLHFEGAVEEVIRPYEKEIIRNEKQDSQTCIYRLLREKSGMNSKKNRRIGELTEHVEIAICQEKQINQNIAECRGQVTCNIGQIIEEIRQRKVIG